MYKLKDIKKLKLDELINIAKSKEIALGKQATKASIIDLFVASGVLNRS
jgi:DNA phosphorothioation-dependent restriction protein DptG